MKDGKVDFSKPPCIYWSGCVKASYLQRLILIHSIAYYELSENILSDSEYDNLCRQLINLREEMSEKEYAKSEYFDVFDNFDGSTGFDLFHRLNTRQQKYLLLIAQNVIKIYKAEN